MNTKVFIPYLGFLALVLLFSQFTTIQGQETFFSSLARTLSEALGLRRRPVRQSPPGTFAFQSQFQPQSQPQFSSQSQFQPQFESSNFNEVSDSSFDVRQNDISLLGTRRPAFTNRAPTFQHQNPNGFSHVQQNNQFLSTGNIELTGESAHCPNLEPNHQYEGRNYILSFLNSACTKFTAQEATNYCLRNGGAPVSLDSASIGEHVVSILAQHGIRYIWTSGKVHHSSSSVTWASGITTPYIRGQGLWSHTGGSRPPQPQPDNRDGDEFCVGLLNNFYADGIKMHDVGCQHKKPVICEL